QSGKPVAVLRTHAGAPRVLIANSLLVPRFANWDEFRRLEAEGLTMFGQMTAGSWIYIGTQGIVQGTFQTFAAAGERPGRSPELARRGVRFDLVTDQTSAHDMLNGYVPMGMTLDEAIALRTSDPDRYVRLARETAVEHVKAMVAFQRAGSHVFDYGNNLRTE